MRSCNSCCSASVMGWSEEAARWWKPDRINCVLSILEGDGAPETRFSPANDSGAIPHGTRAGRVTPAVSDGKFRPS